MEATAHTTREVIGGLNRGGGLAPCRCVSLSVSACVSFFPDVCLGVSRFVSACVLFRADVCLPWLLADANRCLGLGLSDFQSNVDFDVCVGGMKPYYKPPQVRTGFRSSTWRLDRLLHTGRPPRVTPAPA